MRSPTGKSATGLGLDVGQQFQEKADAVLETAAVLVHTTVGIGGQKLVDQVAVGPVNLDEIKPGIPAAPGRVAKRCHQFSDLVDGQFFRDPLHHGRRGNGRRRHFAIMVGLPPPMHQLNAETGAKRLDRRDHFFQGRDACVVPQGGQAGQLQPRRVHAAAAHQDHARPPFGAGRQVAGQLVGDEAVFVHAEIDAHGRHEQPVFGRHPADLDRGKKVFEDGHASLREKMMGIKK